MQVQRLHAFDGAVTGQRQGGAHLYRIPGAPLSAALLGSEGDQFELREALFLPVEARISGASIRGDRTRWLASVGIRNKKTTKRI